MKPLPLPSVEFVREALDYCPETGIFIWKVRPRSHFKTDSGWKTFNSGDSGKTAGALHSQGYSSINLNGAHFLAHRLAWLHATGEAPSKFIDHINGIKTDNRLCNLREATKTENALNSKISCANTSGIKGVCLSGGSANPWKARIRVDGKELHLGRFKTKEEAHEKVRLARELHFGEFANHG